MEVNSVSSDIPSKRRSRSVLFHHFEFLVIKVFVKSVRSGVVLVFVIDVAERRIAVCILFMTVDPDLAVFVFAIFVKREQGYIIPAVAFEYGDDGAVYRTVFKIELPS